VLTKNEILLNEAVADGRLETIVNDYMFVARKT